MMMNIENTSLLSQKPKMQILLNSTDIKTSEDASEKKLPQAKTDGPKPSENNKRELITAPEDPAGNKRQRSVCTDEAADTKTIVTPLAEFGKMMSTMELLMKLKPSMPRKFTTDKSGAIKETKGLDLNEFSIEEKSAYVKAASPALPELLYSVFLQSKFAFDLVQHYKQLAAENKQLAAEERLKREEIENLRRVEGCRIQELEERLVVTQHELSAANRKIKQHEAESQDLWQRNKKLEAAKSAAQTEASEARQQAKELRLKAAKLEAEKSAAEAEAVEAKQQATDSKLKASESEAAKSSAEAVAAESKKGW